jgi:hypothetical protein
MPVKYKPWSFIDAEQNIDMWGVELLEGDFTGAKISINSLKMENDLPECALDFTFIRKPEGRTEEQLTSNEFNAIMTEIINDILTKAIDDFENRESNSPKLGAR